MNLIILTEQDQSGDTHYRLTDNRAEHIRTILKLEVGDHVEVGLLNGPVGVAVVEKIGLNEVIIRRGVLQSLPLPNCKIDLICALPRPQTLKKILLISAMMGVRRLDLIRANRVERSYYQSPLLEPANYAPFLIEGLSQGKRTRLPEVAIHERFRPFFEDHLPSCEANMDVNDTYDAKVVPDLDNKKSLSTIGVANARNILLAIGPEGGWVPFEIDKMREQGFQAVTLGPWVLRVEHAVTAALAQIELVRMQASD